MSRVEPCCEMVAVLWLRQSGCLVDVLKHEVTASKEFLSREDRKVLEWLAFHVGYVVKEV